MQLHSYLEREAGMQLLFFAAYQPAELQPENVVFT